MRVINDINTGNRDHSAWRADHDQELSLFALDPAKTACGERARRDIHMIG